MLVTGIAIACALATAVCAAVGAHLQHRGVRRVAIGERLRLADLRQLVGERAWTLGFLVLLASAAFQVIAISLAPLTVVQPIIVLALPLVALLGARAAGTKLGGLAVAGVSMTTAGVACFVALTAALAIATTVSGEEALRAGLLVAAGVGIAAVFASGRAGRLRCVSLALGAGALYGLVSVFIRHITQTAAAEGAAAVPPLSVAALVGAQLCAAWLVQLAYASGPADLVVAAHTVLNPVTAVAIGAAVLGETAGLGGAATLALLGCAALAIVGVVLLARSHALRLGVPAARPGVDEGGADQHGADQDGAGQDDGGIAAGSRSS